MVNELFPCIDNTSTSYCYIYPVFCCCTCCSCFLSNILVFCVSFLGPLLVVLLFNIVMFVVAVVVLVKHLHRRRHHHKKQNTQNKTIFYNMLGIIGIMFLFGLSWIFAAFTVTIQEIQLPAQVLFTIFSTIQGFGIFIFFCVFSQVARESWKELLSCGRYKSKFLNTSKGISSSNYRLNGATNFTRKPNNTKHTNLMQSSTTTTNFKNSIDYIQEYSEAPQKSTLPRITESNGCVIITDEQPPMENASTTQKKMAENS